MNEEIGNRSTLEGLTRERVGRYPKNAVREVSPSLFRGGNIGEARDALSSARRFVVGKEERAIAYDWTTNRAAKLVAQVLWLWLAGRCEVVSRIERSVAMKFEQ